MVYQKGHPHYPAHNKRHIASTIRQRIPASVFVRFYEAILGGHDPEILEDASSEDGWRVEWKANGLAPTLEQKLVVAKQLLDRGWGQAPQMVALEASLKGELDAGGVPVGLLSPAVMFAIRETLQGALGSPAPTTPQGVIDARSVEVPARTTPDESPADPDQ